MLTLDEVSPILAVMGYQKPEIRCGTCGHYKGADLGGGGNALNEHCELNPAFHLPINELGRCDHHTDL